MEEPRVIRDDVADAQGCLTFAESTRLTCGWLGAERELATPSDDPWYDVPPGPPVLPDVDTTSWARSRSGRQAGTGKHTRQF